MSLKSVTIFLVLISSLTNFALTQRLSIFNIDIANYPMVNSNFYAFDASGVQLIQLTKADLSIVENGNPQKIIKVSNPTYSVPKSLSVVLSVDISSSMAGKNMAIAKRATNALVQLIQLDQSECAVTSFDDFNYIISDFSNDKHRLKTGIDKLQPQGGTNYDEAFNNDLTGALEIVKSGNSKKIVIFLTDGLGHAESDKIVQKAKDLDATIYCVTIGMYAPQVLKEISNGTGGTYYENISTEEQAISAYQKILIEAQGLKPSSIKWLSSPDCESSKLITFEAPKLYAVKEYANYTLSQNVTGQLSTSSNNIKFQNIVSDGITDSTITITATNSNFTVLSASSTNSSFEIVDSEFPLNIDVERSEPITIRYHSTHRKFEESILSLSNDKCTPLVIRVSNGLNNPAFIPLKVESPNGGEVFFAGSDTVINWSGVFPTDKVQLEISNDKGVSWKTFTKDATNQQHQWNVPNLIGDQMLIRASLNVISMKSNVEFLYTRKIDKNGYYYTLGPNNLKIITERADETIILDFMTGESIDTINYVKHNTRDRAYQLSKFSNDGNKLYSFRFGWPVQVFSMTDYKLKGELPKITGRAKFNDEATQYLLNDYPNVNIFDLKTGEVLHEMTFPEVDHSHRYFADSFSDNLVVIVKPNQQISEIWDFTSKTKITSFKTDYPGVRDGIITNDKKYLVTRSSAKTDGHYPLRTKFNVFDIENEKELYTWTNPNDKTILDFAGDLMLRTKNDIPQVVDIASGALIAEIPYTGTAGALSRDGKFIMIYSRNGKREMKMFKFDPYSYAGGKGADVSDKTFSIVAPKLVGNPINYGQVSLGDSKERLFSSFLSNPQNVDVTIDSIYLEGGDNTAFSIVSNRNTFNIKGLDAGDIELRFSPIKLGINKTNIIVQTHFEKIKVSLTGEGVESKISLMDQTINMGKVTIGNAKDSLVKAVIRNTGSTALLISSLTIVGPDLIQFNLESNKGFKLKKNASKDLRIFFKPTMKGKTSTSILYNIVGESGEFKLTVFAEGVIPQIKPPDKIDLINVHPDSLRSFSAQVTDKETGEQLPSTIAHMATTLKNNTGQFAFHIAYKDKLKVIAEADGYLPEVFVLESDPERKLKEVYHNFLLTRVVAGVTVRLDNVLFVQSKSVLLPESYEQLDMLVRYLNTNPEQKIELSGHTDNQGSSKLNQQLSEDRVKAIKEYLIKKGVNNKRISGKGYGSTKPIASNANEKTRRLNRRVEFKIVE